jgi:type IV pilus assembly protein PilQ
MHVGRQFDCRGRRFAQAIRLALAGCAMVLLLAPLAARAQQAAPPVLTVPTGAPPASADAADSESILAEALKAAGVTLPEVPEAAAPGRTNPFASAPPPPPTQNLLLPFTGAPSPETAQVTEEQDGLISLMVRDGSLRQIVAMIAETQQLNLVFSAPADARVTATFEKLPWETVLDSLLTTSGYAWTTRGDVIFVSSLDVADYMPPDAGGQQVEVFELDFASAADVSQAVTTMLSPAGRMSIIESDPMDNRKSKDSITVIDYPAYLARIGQYVCQADQPPRQVFIQAHILQIDLTDDCRNGINFRHIISMSGADVTLRSVGFANPAATSAFLIEPDGVGLDGVIELLQNTTDAKTLASPEVHVVSGQTSRMQIGQNLPYRVTTTTQTATLESVQMLNVGVVLEVTPRVTRDGRVIMRIKPKVSSGSISADTGLPSEKTSQIETDILMCSGQGMVLGGLIEEVDSNIQSKIPWLGDIPYLGILFQKRQVIKSRKETIVTLRPVVLPYTPIMDEIQAEKVFRSEQPLTQGAISSYPRPYEPRMPDTFDHHYKKKAHFADEQAFSEPSAGELMQLPPIEESLEPTIEVLPPGAALEESADAETPTPATEPALQ